MGPQKRNMPKMYLGLENHVNSVDILVGKRVRHGRWMAGTSQSELAEKLSITIHQVQEYEYGKARIEASTLFKIAQIFGVEVSYFFSIPEKNATVSSSNGQKLGVKDVEKADLQGHLAGSHDRLNPIEQQKIVTRLQSRAETDLCCASATHTSYGPE